MLQILLRRSKNNVCLIGDAGVGKTAIVEGLAQLLVSPGAPPRWEKPEASLPASKLLLLNPSCAA
jgi:ATP-dependent Clp protease ATP-binding subunit ClpA